MLGITQEQHPARCRLFAQWHGIDWPILWDPFNLTGSEAVPRFTLVDEHGVVRVARARPDDLDAFLATPRSMLRRATGPPRPRRRPAPCPASGVRRVARVSCTGRSRRRDWCAPLRRRGPVRSGPRHARRTARGAGGRERKGTSHAPRGTSATAWHCGCDTTTRPLARTTSRGRSSTGSRRSRCGPTSTSGGVASSSTDPDPTSPIPSTTGWNERGRTSVPAARSPSVARPAHRDGARRVAARGRGRARAGSARSALVRRRTEGVVRIDAAVAWSTAGGRPAARVHLRAALLDPERASFDAGQSVAGWVSAPAGDGWQVAHRHLAASIPPGAAPTSVPASPSPWRWRSARRKAAAPSPSRGICSCRSASPRTVAACSYVAPSPCRYALRLAERSPLRRWRARGGPPPRRGACPARRAGPTPRGGTAPGAGSRGSRTPDRR